MKYQEQVYIVVFTNLLTCISLKLVENRISEFHFPSLPRAFLSRHVEICKEFTDRQMVTIQCNLDHYPRMSEQYSQWIETVKDACADKYINTYELRNRPIKNSKRIIKVKILDI